MPYFLYYNALHTIHKNLSNKKAHAYITVHVLSALPIRFNWPNGFINPWELTQCLSLKKS